MRNVKTETKVGIFVIVAAVILVVGTSMVGKIRWGAREGYTVTAVFGSVSGLELKSPVRIAGVRVGEVEDIYLKEGLAYVEMGMDPQAVMRRDSEVSISSLGLLGEKYVEITSGSPQSAVVKAGETIHGKEMASMDRLIAEFTDIAKDIKVVTASLRSFLGPEQEESPLTQLLGKVNAMVDNISGLVGDNREGVTQTVASLRSFAAEADEILGENRADLRDAVSNFRQLSERLNTEVADLSAKLDGLVRDVGSSVTGAREDFAGGMDEVKKVASRIDDTVASLQEIVERARRGEGTVGKLLAEETAYDNLNGTLSSFRRVSEKMEKGEGTLGKLLTDEEAYASFTGTFDNINAFITKSDRIKLHVGFRSEYLTEHSDTKSYFSLRISPREDKFYLIEAVDDPRGKYTATDIITTASIDGGGPVTVTERLERFEDELKFSFQFGRRFDDLTIRGGLMESAGGVGSDYWFNEDQGRVSLDLWDFNREFDNPHLKATATYNFYGGLFVNAGVDDILEDELRSVFLGAGLSFSDDDLKYLLSLSSLGF